MFASLIADAELTCIQKALRVARSWNAPCYIFTDSQAALRQTQGTSYLARQVNSIAESLQHPVQLHWCPAHCGIRGNEIADKLAKKGLQKPLPRHDRQDQLVSLSWLKGQIHQKVKERWKQLWDLEEQNEDRGRRVHGLGKQYRLLTRKPPKFAMKPFDYSGFPRSVTSAYLQLRTGIGHIATYLHLIGKTDSDVCRYCARTRQTTTHLLLYCRHFSRQRQQLRRQLMGLPLTTSVLFTTMRGRGALLSFLRETKLPFC